MAGTANVEAEMTTVKLTPAETDHLLTVLRDVRERGDYYGPKIQYWKRHRRIEDRIIAAVGREVEFLAPSSSTVRRRVTP